MNKIKNYYKENKVTIVVSLTIGLIMTVLTGFITKDYSDHIQKDIANKLIRLHVIANSDSDFDQDIKLKVRDNVVELVAELIKSSESIEESRIILNDNIGDIEKIAQETLYANGVYYNAVASLEENIFFPTKSYGDTSFPAGRYEALQIKLGEAQGENWWCVLFPPLCFVDSTYAIASDETKEILKESLTEEEYGIITAGNDVPYKIKFKVVELWQSLFN